MENIMTTTVMKDASEIGSRLSLDSSRELNRDVAMGDPLADWALASELRGSLNALCLCVRVLEGNLNDLEAREYIRHISSATERIERLLAKRQGMRTA